jgi:peptide deformylase
MILPVYVYGNPVLREVSKDITPKYPHLKELIDNMYETLYSADGVGLAAPQIGLSIRLFIVDATVMSEEYPELKDFKKAFINPHILKQEGEEWYYNEGCLSVPNIREDVSRKSVITIQYIDEQFIKHTEVFDGIKARIIQHEHDHLDGILFIDRISKLRKTMLKSKLNNILNGNIKPKYKVVFAKSR